MNCLRSHLREGDTTDLASLDILLIDDTKCYLEGYIRVTAGELEEINLRAPLQLGDTVIQGPASVLYYIVSPLK